MNQYFYFTLRLSDEVFECMSVSCARFVPYSFSAMSTKNSVPLWEAFAEPPFFCCCSDGRKPDSISTMLCRAVSVFPFPDFSVKAVGGDNIQRVSMEHLCGKTEIPRFRADGSASCDSIFQKIPEQCCHVNFGKRERLWQFNMPVRADFVKGRHPPVIAEESIHSSIGAVLRSGACAP